MKKAGIESTKEMTTEEAAEYWSTHEFTEDTPGWEEVDPDTVQFKVKRPLSVMFSIRVDEEHVRKLSKLAASRRTGATTLARQLLYEALDAAEIADSKNGPTKKYLVTSEQLEQLGEAVSTKVLGSMLRAMSGRVNETPATAEYGTPPKRARKTAANYKI